MGRPPGTRRTPRCRTRIPAPRPASLRYRCGRARLLSRIEALVWGTSTDAGTVRLPLPGPRGRPPRHAHLGRLAGLHRLRLHVRPVQRRAGRPGRGLAGRGGPPLDASPRAGHLVLDAARPPPALEPASAPPHSEVGRSYDGGRDRTSSTRATVSKWTVPKAVPKGPAPKPVIPKGPAVRPCCLKTQSGGQPRISLHPTLTTSSPA